MHRVLAAAQEAQARPHFALRPIFGLSIFNQLRKYPPETTPRNRVVFLQQIAVVG